MSGNLKPDDDISYAPGDDDDDLSEDLSVDDKDSDPFLVNSQGTRPTAGLRNFSSRRNAPPASSVPAAASKRNPIARPSKALASAAKPGAASPGGKAGDHKISISDLRKLSNVRKVAKPQIDPTRMQFPTPSISEEGASRKSDNNRSLTAEEIYGKANVGLGPGTPSESKRRARRFGSGGGPSGINQISKPSGRFREKFSRLSTESRSRKSIDGETPFEDKDIALANLANASENDISAAANIVRHGNMNITHKRLKKGENVLVAFDNNDNFGFEQQLTSRPVNKFGFPKGMGKSEHQRKGPYVYVLAEVLEVKFNEYSTYYLVKRYDTGNCQRADSGWIEPIRSASEGEKAAMAAAKQTVDTHGSNPTGQNNFFDSSCVYATRRNVSMALRASQSLCLDQAMRCLSGGSPYRLKFKVTTVNMLVVCSSIVAFFNQVRYAFLGVGIDNAVMVVIFIAWVVLMLELIFEVFVRPEDYSKLLKAERAYYPSTVRYINGFHLVFEFVALMFVIPDFLPLFNHRVSNGTSFIQAAINASHGKTNYQFIGGHLIFMLTRMRVFGLVRHRRNHWISKQGTSTPNKEDSPEHKPLLNDEDKASSKKNREREDLIGDLDEDVTLRRADTIGTALVLVNSHRTLLLLLLITFIVPLFVTLASGGRSKSIYNMTGYLHGINNQTPIDIAANETDGFDCRIFKTGVDSWCNAEHYTGNPNTTSVAHNSHQVVSIEVEPNRTSSKDWGDCIPSCLDPWPSETMEDLYERHPGIRHGALLNVTEEDGVVRTTVIFNMTATVRRTAFNFFMLQLSSLLFTIVWLGWLRSDAKRNVIAPLRRMLKIVLRYAENPLAGAPTREENAIDEFDASEKTEKDTVGTKVMSNETAQLIRAVTTITDLLRQCWGVAGAGIISSNLARNMGGENIVVFNPIVPGKQVYALFGFAGISDYSFILRSLEKDTMTFINDVARVLHNEVFRWGFGESGQCNRNLGSAFLLVYRIGDFAEVAEMKARAIDVFFQMGDGGKDQASTRSSLAVEVNKDHIQLASLPGISRFADRALLGILKTFAGIYRDKNIKKWEDTDYRLGGGVGAFKFEMTFGMDAGWAVEGAVGSSYKIDATYLSPHLNMASRMMMAAKQYKVAILITQGMEELLSSPAKKVMRHLDTVFVKGSKVPQRVYTYDARREGVRNRADHAADEEAENYSETIWTNDADLRDMRSHVSPEFETSYSMGLQQYLIGNFKEALAHFVEANDIMEKNDVKNDLPLREEELGDGPCQTLIEYIEKENFVAPPGWDGVRKLTNK